MAEIVGFNTELLQPRVKRWKWWFAISIHAAVMSSSDFLDGVAPDDARRYAGCRASRFKNLWLNTGHGTLGWTMAAVPVSC